MNAQIRVVVFDFDGTLVDTMGAFADKASQLMASYYDIDCHCARELYLKTSGYPFGQQLQQLFGNNPLNTEVAERFETWKLELLDGPLEPRPGVKQMILDLQAVGYRVAISSNNSQANVDQLVADWDFPLESALGFRNKSFCKGEPHFSWLRRELQVKRSEMLFVGDSLNDFRMALHSNVAFAAVTYTFPEECFRSLNHSVRCFTNVIQVGDWLVSQRRLLLGGKDGS